MHFSIPDTEEFSDESGSTYMVRTVTRNDWNTGVILLDGGGIFMFTIYWFNFLFAKVGVVPTVFIYNYI